MLADFIILNILRPIIHLLCRIFFKIKFYGVENIPSSGPVIIAPNHVSYLDPVLAAVPVNRRVYFMTWDRLFDLPAFSQLIQFLGAFPVKLEGGDRRATNRARQLLEEGKVLMIFPEGGRSRDGRLMLFKSGGMRLAVESGAAVVPTTIKGAFEAWPAHKKLPRPNRITITYHKPIMAAPTSGELEPSEIKLRAKVLAQQAQDCIARSLD